MHEIIQHLRRRTRVRQTQTRQVRDEAGSPIGLRTPVVLKIAAFVVIACAVAALAAQCAPAYRRAAWLSQIETMPRRVGVVEHASGPLTSVVCGDLPTGFIGVEYGPAKCTNLDEYCLNARLGCVLYREPRTVHLCYTEFHDHDLPLLADVSTVKNLQLTGTRLTDAGMSALQKLPRLEVLSLSHTSVGDAGALALSHCHLLNSLNLRGTQLTNDGLRHLGRLSNLQVLDISNTAVTGEGVQDLTVLPQLETLHLEGLDFRDADVAMLRNCSRLLYLDLTRTPLTDEGLLTLANTVHFAALIVTGTQVTPAGIQEFRRLRPDVGLKYGDQYPAISR